MLSNYRNIMKKKSKLKFNNIFFHNQSINQNLLKQEHSNNIRNNNKCSKYKSNSKQSLRNLSNQQYSSKKQSSKINKFKRSITQTKSNQANTFKSKNIKISNFYKQDKLQAQSIQKFQKKLQIKTLPHRSLSLKQKKSYLQSFPTHQIDTYIKQFIKQSKQPKNIIENSSNYNNLFLNRSKSIQYRKSKNYQICDNNFNDNNIKIANFQHFLCPKLTHKESILLKQKSKQLQQQWKRIAPHQVNKQKLRYKSLYMLQHKTIKNAQNSIIKIQDIENISDQNQQLNDSYLFQTLSCNKIKDKNNSSQSQQQNSSISTVKTFRQQKNLGIFIEDLISYDKNHLNSRMRKKEDSLLKRSKSKYQKSFQQSKPLCIQEEIFNILRRKGVVPLEVQEDSQSQKAISKTYHPFLQKSQIQQQSTMSLEIKTNCFFQSKKFSEKKANFICLKKITVRPFQITNPGFYIDFWIQIQGLQIVRRVQWQIPKKTNQKRPNISLFPLKDSKNSSQNAKDKQKKKNHQPYQRKIKQIFCKIFSGSKGKNLLQTSILQNKRNGCLGERKKTVNPYAEKKKVTIIQNNLNQYRIKQIIKMKKLQGYDFQTQQFGLDYFKDIIQFIQDFSQLNKDYTGYSIFGVQSKYSFYKEPKQCFQVDVSNKKNLEEVIFQGILHKMITNQSQISIISQQIKQQSKNIEKFTISSVKIQKTQISQNQIYTILKLVDHYFLVKLTLTVNLKRTQKDQEKLFKLFLIHDLTSNIKCQSFQDIKKVINNQDQIFKGYFNQFKQFRQRQRNQLKILNWKKKLKKKLKKNNISQKQKIERHENLNQQFFLQNNHNGFQKLKEKNLISHANYLNDQALKNNKQLLKLNAIIKIGTKQAENQNLLKSHNRYDSQSKHCCVYWPNSNFVYTDPSIKNFFVYHQSFNYGYFLHDKQFMQGYCDGIYYTIERIKNNKEKQLNQRNLKKIGKNVKFQGDSQKERQSQDSKIQRDQNLMSLTYIVRVWQYPNNYAFIIDSQYEIEQFLILHIPDSNSNLINNFYKKAFLQRRKNKYRNCKKINQASKDNNIYISQDLEQRNKHQQIKAHNQLFPYIGGFQDDIGNLKKSINFSLIKDKKMKVHVRVINNYLLMHFVEFKSEKVWKFYCPLATYNEIKNILKNKTSNIQQEQNQQYTNHSNANKRNKSRVQRNSLIKSYDQSFKQIKFSRQRTNKNKQINKQLYDQIIQSAQQNSMTNSFFKFKISQQIQNTQSFLQLICKQKKIVYSSYIIGQRKKPIKKVQYQNQPQTFYNNNTYKKINQSFRCISSKQSIHSQKSIIFNQYSQFDIKLNKIKKQQSTHINQSFSFSNRSFDKQISTFYLGKIYQIILKKTIKICHGVFIILVIYKIINYNIYQLKFYLPKTRKMYFSPYLLNDFQFNTDSQIDRLTQFLRFNFLKKLVDQEKDKRHKRCQEEFSHMVDFTYEMANNLRNKKSIKPNINNININNNNNQVQNQNTTVGSFNLVFQQNNFGTSLLKKTRKVSKVNNAVRITAPRNGRHSSFKTNNKNLLSFPTIIQSPTLKINEELLIKQQCISQFFVSPRGNSYFVRVSYTHSKDIENFNKFPIQKDQVCVEVYKQNYVTYLHYYLTINSIISETLKEKKLRKNLISQKTDEIKQFKTGQLVDILPKALVSDSFLTMKKITPSDWRYLLYKIKNKICKQTKYQKFRQISKSLKKMTQKNQKKDWIQALKSISQMKRQLIKMQAGPQYCIMTAKDMACRTSFKNSFAFSFLANSNDYNNTNDSYSIYLQNRGTKQVQQIKQWNGSFSSCVPLQKMNSRLFRRMCRQIKKSYCQRIIYSQWDSEQNSFNESQLREKVYDLFGNLISNDYSSQESSFSQSQILYNKSSKKKNKVPR